MTKSPLPPARRNLLTACFVIGVAGWLAIPGQAEEGTQMKIKFDIDGTPVVTTLEDNPTSRSLIDMLPLTVTLEDYAATEKIARLPGPLSTQGAPAGMEPKTGDFTYYAPWGNLAIFTKDFRHSVGLVKLGRIEQGFSTLKATGPVEVTLRLVED